MANDKPGAGWGTEAEVSLEYDNDNYYLLTWDDPSCMEIRNTNQVIAALATSLAEGEYSWQMHNASNNTNTSRDIKVLMDWLNAEQDGAERFPSNNFISDDCGYVWIRRILTKYEDC